MFPRAVRKYFPRRARQVIEESRTFTFLSPTTFPVIFPLTTPAHAWNAYFVHKVTFNQATWSETVRACVWLLINISPHGRKSVGERHPRFPLLENPPSSIRARRGRGSQSPSFDSTLRSRIVRLEEKLLLAMGLLCVTWRDQRAIRRVCTLGRDAARNTTQ